MRPSTLALALLVLIAAAAGILIYRQNTAERRAWSALLAYEGTYLTDQSEAHALFLKFVGPADRPKGFLPWSLMRLDSRVAVLEMNTIEPFPRPWLIRAHVFSEDGAYLGLQAFRAGSACLDDGARVVTNPAVSIPLLELRSGGSITSRYYALLDDQLVLVRLEDRSGIRLDNNYEDADLTVGPPLPERTAEDTEEALSSPILVELLRTLSWLGARHPKESLAHDVLRRPDVRARIEELKKSPNPWIREAATAVK